MNVEIPLSLEKKINEFCDLFKEDPADVAEELVKKMGPIINSRLRSVEARMLRTLRDDGPATVPEIAALIGASKASVSGQIPLYNGCNGDKAVIFSQSTGNRPDFMVQGNAPKLWEYKE